MPAAAHAHFLEEQPSWTQIQFSEKYGNTICCGKYQFDLAGFNPRSIFRSVELWRQFQFSEE